jgi:hypothetical protein
LTWAMASSSLLWSCFKELILAAGRAGVMLPVGRSRPIGR